jgi:hypothetical protein
LKDTSLNDDITNNTGFIDFESDDRVEIPLFKRQTSSENDLDTIDFDISDSNLKNTSNLDSDSECESVSCLQTLKKDENVPPVEDDYSYKNHRVFKGNTFTFHDNTVATFNKEKKDMTVDEIVNLIENPQTAIHIQWRKSEYRSYSKEKEENIKSHKWISILRLKLKDEYECKSNWYHRVPVSPHKNSPDRDIVIDKNAIVTRNSKDFFTTAEEIKDIDTSQYHFVGLFLVRSDLVDLAKSSENMFRLGDKSRLNVLYESLSSGDPGLFDLMDNVAVMEMAYILANEIYFSPDNMILQVHGNGYLWVQILLVNNERICIAPICNVILFGWCPTHPISEPASVIYIKNGRVHRSNLYISLNGQCRVRSDWDDFYDQLLEYKSRFGNCNITARDTLYPDLAKW